MTLELYQKSLLATARRMVLDSIENPKAVKLSFNPQMTQKAQELAAELDRRIQSRVSSQPFA